MNTHSTQNVASRISARTVVAAVLAVIAAIFILQNRSSTAIQLVWITVQAPLWLVLLAVVALGWVVGFMTARRPAKTDT